MAFFKPSIIRSFHYILVTIPQNHQKFEFLESVNSIISVFHFKKRDLIFFTKAERKAFSDDLWLQPS
ncbi:hypothetical protein AKJ49_00605 [candidate division MSBL1 archaeon SCGC-AAA382A03]|uniref:Uncharacterized protein n=1 Tax=candidate division MSBL1 archaeon SCGC-AAA382A03 TaxID=1698278 RepID=A0A133VGE2_9EURY|nr:hypothetical protein AKJ49_00605 [candidate division MSBL1 archaeon SCGC-AAA382A03]